PIFDILEVYGGEAAKQAANDAKEQKIAEAAAEYVVLEPKVLAKRIKELEQQMLAKARDLQFEQAAKIRDEMMRLKEQLLVQQV
ncbi:MAG TPA: UvrB/UvrC motif-containing protein, partial [Agitococcus sp.]|nr:UvrB/UvrC motif-containing protein [Agitococcus sp.]